MKIVGIIQTRIKTPREKLILEKVNNRKIIDHFLNTINKINTFDSIILAAPENSEKILFSKIASDHQIKVFFGPNNILERLILAAQQEKADLIVRFTGNAPFFDKDLTRELIKIHLSSNADYSYGKGFPQGILPEVINVQTLLKVRKIHCPGAYHCYIKENPDLFKTSFLKNTFDLEDIRLNINSDLDLLVAKEIFKSISQQKLSYKNLILNLPSVLTNLMHSLIDSQKKRILNKTLNMLESAMKLDTLHSLPPFIRIDPHNLCNIKCKTCYQQFDNLSEETYHATFRSFLNSNVKNYPLFFKNKKNVYKKKSLPLNSKTFQKIKLLLFSYIERVNFGACGEPFLNKNLLKMIGECKEHGLITQLLTNGTLLTDKILEKIVCLNVDDIVVSFDGASRKLFEEMRRGADYNKIIASFKKLNKLKEKNSLNKPNIGLLFTASNENIDELPRLTELAYEWRVASITIGNRYISDYMNPAHSIFYHREKCRQSILKSKEFALKYGIDIVISPLIESLLNNCSNNGKCKWPWNDVYIDSIGKVHLCCCSGMRPVGDIMKQPFDEIWNSPDFKNLRKSFSGESNLFLECQYCMMGNQIDKEPNIRAFMSEAHI